MTRGEISFRRPWEERELLSMIIAHPPGVLYAPSGAGKSSLINAKLISLFRGVSRSSGRRESRVSSHRVSKRRRTGNLISSFRESGGGQLYIRG